VLKISRSVLWPRALNEAGSLAFLLQGRNLSLWGRTRAPSGIIVAISLVNVVQSAVATLRDMPGRECAVVVTRSRAPNSSYNPAFSEAN
jgi:hypothetical protein